MRRRKLLLSLGPAAMALSGCLETQSSNTNTTSEPMCDDLTRFQITCENGEISNFKLSILHSPSSIGEALQVSMMNTTTESQISGNRYKYDIQKSTDQGWQSVFWVDPRPAWSDEAIGHDPDTGFTWKFTFTQEGLSREIDVNPDYYICSSLAGGKYRFVYFGLGTRCIDKEFMV